MMDIGKNIAWLREHGSAPVRYRTHRDMARRGGQGGEAADSARMKRLWAEVEGCPEAQEIFAGQREDGSWFGGLPWARRAPYRHRGAEPYSPHSPKYVTTAWVLPVLGDMGFTVGDERVRRACDYMLAYKSWGGVAHVNDFVETRKATYPEAFRYTCCGPAFHLTGLGKVGLSDDPRLRKSYDLALQLQREDGGWVNQHHKDATHAPYKVWDRSCPYATYRAADALFHARNPRCHDALRRALGFLLRHLAAKRDDDIRQFYYHGHHTLRELLMLSETGVGLGERPVRVLLDWLMGMYRPDDGCFRFPGRPIPPDARRRTGVTAKVLKYNFHHLVEDDWLTYYMTRIAMNLEKHGAAAGSGCRPARPSVPGEKA